MLSLIEAAKWPIWTLIVASIIALALIIERLWSLRQSVVDATSTRYLEAYRRVTGSELKGEA